MESNSAKIVFHDKEWEVEPGRTIREVVVSLGLDPYEVLALKDKKIVSDRTVIEPGDEIRLVNVISGG